MKLKRSHAIMVVALVLLGAAVLVVALLPTAGAQCAPWDINCMNLP